MKIKHVYFLFSNFLSENRTVHEVHVEKCGGAREVVDNMARARAMLHK